MNVPPSPFSTAPVSTVQIQKLLDENKQLILVILENQNLGKLAECAQYQAMLQKNLMYLAAIADAQPQVVLSQTPTQPAPQQGHFMQHPQPMHQMSPSGLVDPSNSVMPQEAGTMTLGPSEVMARGSRLQEINNPDHVLIPSRKNPQTSGLREFNVGEGD